MKLEVMTKKQLIEYINSKTMPMLKYNKLETKLDISKRANEEKDEVIAGNELKEGILENTIKQIEKNQKVVLQTAEDQANAYIKQATAGVTALQGDLQYAQHTLFKNFEMFNNLREHVNNQHNMFNKVLDTYASTIFKVEEKKDDKKAKGGNE